MGRQAALIDESTVHVSLLRPFSIRASSVRAVTVSKDAWTETRLLRRARARDFDEPLGGASDPIVNVEGDGEMIARAENQRLALLELDDECLTIKEDILFGFDAQLRYDVLDGHAYGPLSSKFLRASSKSAAISAQAGAIVTP